MLKYPSIMRSQDFIIDTTCYPWFAYKGYRFAPTESHLCFTDIEETLIEHIWVNLGSDPCNLIKDLL